jgi:predicted translin family RNA/ssDNA-binding protein
MFTLLHFVRAENRFAATFSGGLQEYIEAVSFWQYLVDGSCISKPQIEALIREDAPHDQTFVVPLVDYLLGLCDLTGELMRFAISTVSKGDRQSAFTVCAFVREVHAGFLRLHVGHRDMQQKLETMLACLIKIEKICYQVNVRGAEFPDRIISLQVDEKENMPAE